MTTISNITDLRNRVLKAIDDLEDGKIDMSQASTIAKLSETVISGLKSEMQYAILTNQKPQIPFYGEQKGELLDTKKIMKLL